MPWEKQTYALQSDDDAAVLLVAAVLRRAREDAKRGDRKAQRWIEGVQEAVVEPAQVRVMLRPDARLRSVKPRSVKPRSVKPQGEALRQQECRARLAECYLSGEWRQLGYRSLTAWAVAELGLHPKSVQRARRLALAEREAEQKVIRLAGAERKAA